MKYLCLTHLQHLPRINWEVPLAEASEHHGHGQNKFNTWSTATADQTWFSKSHFAKVALSILLLIPDFLKMA
jgi:hypothetical protein